MHLTSTAICASGRQFQDWSADYRVCSRSPWEPRQLFDVVLDHLPGLLPSAQAPVFAALDDTILKKTGRRIPGVKILRDPMSPPFRVNLCYGLRFVQVSVLVSPHDQAGPARALPVRFDFAPPANKPNKKASEEAWAQYREEQKQRTLSLAGVDAIVSLRACLDERPETRHRQLIVSGDGSYTNRTMMRGLPERTTYIGRLRKDAKLHYPLPASSGKPVGRPRRYGPEASTPEQILHDDSMAVVHVKCFAAGQFREIPVKVLRNVYWRKSGADMPVQVVVIKPLGYRLRNGSKLLYRKPAFLVCTDPDLDLTTLVQAYINRWEIGVSSQGHIVQSVKDRPGPKDSGPVAWEAPWRESKTAEPSDNMLRKEHAQRTRLQRAVNAEVASLHEFPVAETVYNARKQQGLTETSPMRQFSPAGYQRRHGVKEDVETGETLGARRRNFVEEMLAITASGKCWHRHQGDGSGRSVR
ncbi:MAG: transposase [Bryobacteraceae bacterium]